MLEIPENLNIADYYLDRNLTVGRGDNTAIYYKEKHTRMHRLLR